jgi:hypothetical protein
MKPETATHDLLQKVIIGFLLLLCFPLFVVLIALAWFSSFALVLLVMVGATAAGAAVHYQTSRSGVLESVAIAMVWSLAFALPYGLSLIFQGFRPAWMAHLIVAALAAAAIAAALRARRPDTVGRPFSVMAAGTLSAYLAVSLMLPLTIAEQARTLAGAAPYCIQAATRDGAYAPAETLMDLSALTLWATNTGGHSSQFHAVLVVGDAQPQLFNWSYRRRSFMPLPAGREVVHCRPQPRFADALPLLFASAGADTRYFHLVGRTFVIPSAFEPRGSVASSASLRFIAVAPDFTPLDPPCPDIRICLQHWIEVHLRPQSVMSWLTTQDAQVQENEADPNGPRITRIKCWPAAFNAGHSCEHVFLRDGMVVRFKHPAEDLPQWRALQANLVARLRSFQRIQP